MNTLTKVPAHELRCGMRFDLFETDCIITRTETIYGMVFVQFVLNTGVHTATSHVVVPVTLEFDILKKE